MKQDKKYKETEVQAMYVMPTYLDLKAARNLNSHTNQIPGKTPN